MVKNKEIKYLNKDFTSLRNSLIEFTKTYFANSYNDFTAESIGMMFIELSSYVGDVMSFYLDNQIQETFTQYAKQSNNLFEKAYMFGYKPKITSLAVVDTDIYQLLPSKLQSGQYVPDYDYALYVENNTKLSSRLNPSIQFLLEDSIDFSLSSSYDPTEISVYKISNNNPEYFLLKKTRKAHSGNINTLEYSFGEPQEFPTIILTGERIAGILDITDNNGNKWYEVDYLAQDTIYNTNNIFSDQNTPYSLTTQQVQRRFVTRFLDNNTLQIQFGSGKNQDNDEDIIPNPTNVGIGLPFGISKLTTAYSPTNFIFTNTYGIAPSNVTLTIRYITGGGVISNIPSNDLVTIDNSTVNFIKSNLDPNISNYIFNSLVSNNPVAASGGGDGDSVEELRQNILSTSSSQLRMITPDDYLIRILSLPPKYGSLAKAIVKKSSLTNDTLLEAYVLAYDKDKHLTTASTILKDNITEYISQYNSFNNIIIKDAFPINISCDFDITVRPNYNGNEVIQKCILSLTDYFNIDNWTINQPIILSDISLLLHNIPGVQTVKEISIKNQAGVFKGYSKYAYDISGATKNNIIYPSKDPSIFELKYPSDIRGRISTL
jgi:hypothetical protein